MASMTLLFLAISLFAPVLGMLFSLDSVDKLNSLITGVLAKDVNEIGVRIGVVSAVCGALGFKHLLSIR